MGCEPLQTDYRKPYTGDFIFTTQHKTVEMCYDTDPDINCVNGWFERTWETTTISSDVKSFKTDQLQIKFGAGNIGIADNDSILRQTIYPVLELNGNLSLSDFPGGPHYSFTGHFIGLDTITIILDFGYGNGAYSRFEVLGVRKE